MVRAQGEQLRKSFYFRRHQTTFPFSTHSHSLLRQHINYTSCSEILHPPSQSFSTAPIIYPIGKDHCYQSNPACSAGLSRLPHKSPSRSIKSAQRNIHHLPHLPHRPFADLQSNMNTAYVPSSHGAQPHDAHRPTVSTMDDVPGPYRPGPYSMPVPQNMGMQPQGMYGESYNQIPGGRPHMPEGLHVQIGEGMMGAREMVMPEPISKSFVEGNRRYE